MTHAGWMSDEEVVTSRKIVTTVLGLDRTTTFQRTAGIVIRIYYVYIVEAPRKTAVFNLHPATQCYHLDAFLWPMQVARCTSLPMVQAQLLAVAATQPQLRMWPAPKTVRRQPLQLRLAPRPAPPLLLPQIAMSGYTIQQRQRCGRSNLHRQPKHRADRPVLRSTCLRAAALRTCGEV